MSSSAANLTSSRNDDPLDEPPPYTPRADPLQGESTVEYGPRRPFQQPPAAPSPAPVPEPTHRPAPLSPQSTGVSRRGRSLWQQLTDQIDQFANELERRGANGGANASRRVNPTPQRTGAPWSSYPGGSSTNAPTLPPPRNVPPLPPRRRAGSTSSLPETPSDFARDFYAAGTGNGLYSDTERNQTSLPRSGTVRVPQNNLPPENSPLREDRSPTTTPTPGRPLLRDGKLLVYPRGHACEKCFNTGYKHFDPDQPCKKCWNKYAKPFSGPLAYSYSSSSASSNTQNTNLQKPLPAGPSYRSPPRSLPSPTRPATYNGWHAVPQRGMYGRGPYVTSNPMVGPPPPGTTVYRPGDPRIGGNLCWSCNGKGTMSIIVDVINCPICDGCGRTF